MKAKYYMPTRVIAGEDCLRANPGLLAALCGKAVAGSGAAASGGAPGAAAKPRALVITGKNSARLSGALDDALAALAAAGIGAKVFDRIPPNPGPGICREAGREARAFGAGFIVAIGGGSPLDAAKVAALVAKDESGTLDGDGALFSGQYPAGALPLVAIPTTAGTGSEVTHYAILTDDAAQSKRSVTSDLIFPALAFLDARYTEGLSPATATNTALDALSHSVEGFLSAKADDWSRALAREALALQGPALARLAEALESGSAGALPFTLREDLLLASSLSGAVIAQTGTTIVHAMGYSLTFFRDIDHGRANGLLLRPFMEEVAAETPDAAAAVLAALGLESLQKLNTLLDRLLGAREVATEGEVAKWSAMAMKARHVGNTPIALDEGRIAKMYRAGLGAAI